MPETPFYHFGILVPRIEDAVEQYSDLFGIRFREPSVIRFLRMREREEGTLDLRAAYSIEGPPHVELIEASGDGVFGAHQGYGFHHVGVWDPAIDANKDVHLRERGVGRQAEAMMANGCTFSWFSEPATTHGIRFEFVDEAFRPMLEAASDPGAPRHEGPFTV